MTNSMRASGRTGGTRPGAGARIGMLLLLGTAITAAGCGGGTAATAAPATAAATAAVTTAPTDAATTTPSKAPTATPTAAATTMPSEAAGTTPVPAGTLANVAADFVVYYTGQGYSCIDPTPSTQAQGWMTTRCIQDNGTTAPSNVIGLVVDPNGVLGDVFAGVVSPAGSQMPGAADMMSPLSFVLGAALGETDGTTAATWLAANLGKESASTKVNGNTIATYTENDANGVGAYVEIATPSFLGAPAPAG